MRTKAFFLIAFCLFLPSTILFAQNESKLPPPVFGGFVDIYTAINFNEPASSDPPSFLYNHTSTNQLAVNLAMYKAKFGTDEFRTNVALMTGTYANRNLSSEPTFAQFIYEANIGIKLSKKRATWLDVGVMPSHIGFESAISKDCPSLTRSIMAENSPYYETGLKLSSKSKDEKWTYAFLVLNGWQRIVQVPGNNVPSMGWQVVYQLNENISLNSNSFIGNNYPDSLRRMRYFHNFYITWKVNEKISLIADMDNGVEQKSKNSSKYNSWFSLCAILRYAFNEKNSVSLRTEYYEDVNHVIIGATNGLPFAVSGASLNFDHSINEYIHFRMEGKAYNAKNKLFEQGHHFTNTLGLFTTSISAYF